MIRDRILFGGDSIREGFGDSWNGSEGVAVSTRGIGGKLILDSWLNNQITTTPHASNVGCSGFTVPQYLARLKGFIEADPTRITACVFSVWSPNIPDGETPPYACSAPVLAANRVEVLSFVAYLISQKILPIPDFIYASPFLLSSADFVRLKNEMDWFRTYFSHDGTVTGSYMSFVGGVAYADGGLAQDSTSSPAFAGYPAEYRGFPIGDATHPPPAGYTRAINYFNANWPTLRANAMLAYNVTE